MSLPAKNKRILLGSCLLLFGLALWLGHPVYGSGDDVYLLYLMGGGFGAPPTALLHYNYLMHPGLGIPLSALFTYFPVVNWYSLALYGGHLTACLLLANLLSGTRNLSGALTALLVLLAVFEIPFLLQPTFSNTALVLSVAALTGLLAEAQRPAGSLARMLPYLIVLLVASLFRFHVLIPIIVTSLPFMLTVARRQKITALLLHLTVGGCCLFLLHAAQVRFYERRIPGWDQEEQYRQAVFDLVNRPLNKQIASGDPAAAMKQGRLELLENGMFWDRRFLSVGAIRALGSQTRLATALEAPGFSSTLYWLFTNNRLYLAVLAAAMATLALTIRGNCRRWLAPLASLALALGMTGGLLVFGKLPPYFLEGMLLGVSFYWAVLTAPFLPAAAGYRQGLNWLGAACLLVWAGIRMEKTAAFNQAANRRFVCAWQQVHARADSLFIVTDNRFPLDYFSVWQSPNRFPLANLLYRDLLFNHTEQDLYRRFSIRDPGDLATGSRVFFLGGAEQSIPFYYRQVWNLSLRYRAASSAPGCLPVWVLEKTTP